MKKLLASLLVAATVAAAAPGFAEEAPDFEKMPIEQLKAEAASLHPVALYVLAGRLLAQGEGVEAARWMYVGQLRYRFRLEVAGDEARNEKILFAVLSEQIGRPVNEYIGGNPDEWIAAIRWALDWDAANDNKITSKTEHAGKLAELRRGLEELAQKVDSSRDYIREFRAKKGLENR